MTDRTPLGMTAGVFNYRLLFLFLFLLIIQLNVCPTSASEGTLEVNSSVDKSEITVGDKITYKIEVTYPGEGVVELPSVLGNLGSFEVKEFNQGEPEKAGSNMRRTWTLLISTFTVGPYTIPPQVVEYTPLGDTAKLSTYTEPIIINVERSSPETVKDIADITGLINFRPGGSYTLWIIIVILILLAGGALWFVYYMDKGKVNPPPPPPPYEEARDALYSLKSRNLPAKGFVKEYCFALSEIVRRYITRRYQIDALESTTEEFLEKLLSIKITLAQRESLQAFCTITDPVKFASFTIDVSQADNTFNVIKEFIEQTKPALTQDESGSAKTGDKVGQSS